MTTLKLHEQPERVAKRDEFLKQAGWGTAQRRLLAGDASFRRYDRLTLGQRTAVLMDAPPPHEDVRPFTAVRGILGGLGLSAPALYAGDEAEGFLLLEDLGDDTYTRLLQRGTDEPMLYRLAVDVLVELTRNIGPADLKSLPALDDARALDEVSRLTEWWWPAAMGAPIPSAVLEEYRAAWRAVLPRGRQAPESIGLFDYHVDNLLWLPRRQGVAACGLLDFQDAVRVPAGFDLMSLLQDARRDLQPGLEPELYERFLAGLPKLDRASFADAFAVFGAERHSRIIGTFVRLWKRDGKPGYLVHLPRVWRQLESALAAPAMAPLKSWFDRHVPREKRGAISP
ncbi:MAG TPA: phosphotransferase [Hypericibacter adhaerens]|jgi:aminoglycoside/choline kinase family phosphotransferase|uniref:aminoglycoside phosphotransferase family protein n=1 Tax=Hypericibacter adhaerens TaxID=2602016 RepID=UPI002BF4E969|nr:phosphotransferase [Hypericibacter adhaerens]HWA45328.1 phosphotransferase [Hypericibacter adhaerens]